MYIDKVEPFYTEEERKRLEELWKSWDEVNDRWNQVLQNQDPEENARKLLAEFLPIQAERDRLRDAARLRYIQHFDEKADILKDIEEVLAALEPEDHEDLLDLMPEGRVHKDIMFWVWMRLRPQIEALDYWHYSKEEAVKLAAAKADEIAGPEEEDYSRYLNTSMTEYAAPSIRAAKAEKVSYPTDKANSSIWNLKRTDGQLAFDFGEISLQIDTANAADRKAGILVTTSYSINFDGLKDDVAISKRLTPFDKRVYIACSALFDAGFSVVTMTQIYKAMGNSGSPSPKQIEKVRTSIRKMMSAIITIDNAVEAKRYDYPHLEYEGNLLYAERVKASDHSRTAEAVHILRRPILIAYSAERKQCETIDSKLLQGPISKTDENLAIEDYLLHRILRANHDGKTSEKILFRTICDHAGITAQKQRQRLPEKVKTYLDYYKECGQIKRHTMAKDSVTIFFK